MKNNVSEKDKRLMLLILINLTYKNKQSKLITKFLNMLNNLIPYVEKTDKKINRFFKYLEEIYLIEDDETNINNKVINSLISQIEGIVKNDI